jgi:hypothetical protein
MIQQIGIGLEIIGFLLWLPLIQNFFILRQKDVSKVFGFSWKEFITKNINWLEIPKTDPIIDRCKQIGVLLIVSGLIMQIFQNN